MPLQTEKILATFKHDTCIDKSSATVLRTNVLDDSLTGLVPERIFINTTTGAQVDGNTLTSFFIETDLGGNPIKHMENLDVAWQALTCSWDDELYDNAGTWVIKSDVNRMEEEATPVKDRIKTSADNFFNAQNDRFSREIEALRAFAYDFPTLAQADSTLEIDVLLNPTGNKATFDVGDAINQCRDYSRKIYLGLDTFTNLLVDKAAENTFNWKRFVKQYVIGWWANELETDRLEFLNYINDATVWAASTVYAASASVYDPVTNNFYYDLVGHTSSAVDFATDAGTWTEIIPFSIVWEPYPKTQLAS